MSVVLEVSSEYFHMHYIMHMPGSIAQAVARLAEKTAVPDSINGPAHTFVEMDHENFLRVLSPLSLIQEVMKDSCQLLAEVWALNLLNR